MSQCGAIAAFQLCAQVAGRPVREQLQLMLDGVGAVEVKGRRENARSRRDDGPQQRCVKIAQLFPGSIGPAAVQCVHLPPVQHVQGVDGLRKRRVGKTQPGEVTGSHSQFAYSYKTVTIKGKARSELNGVNASGAYAGEGLNSTFTGIKLFVASPSGQLTFYRLPFKNLSTTAPFYESASGMDNAGDMVGGWTGTGGRSHGLKRQADGKITEIDDPSAADVNNGGTLVEGISADGRVIVGAYHDSSLALHGFLLEGGKFTSYDVPGAADTVVNFYEHGTFGGYYVSSTGAMFGFYVQSGRLHTVAAPGEANPPAGFGTELTAASADGTLFADVFPAGKPIYAFSAAHGRYTTIRDPNQVGTTDLDGTAVNGASVSGVVVGGYTYTSGTSTVGGLVTAFIATPRTRS